MSTIQDMNNRIKQNRAQRPSKRAKFKGNNRKLMYPTGKKPEGPLFNTLPKEALIELKNQIRKRAEKEKKHEQIENGAFVVLLILLLFGMLLWLN